MLLRAHRTEQTRRPQLPSPRACVMCCEVSLQSTAVEARSRERVCAMLVLVLAAAKPHQYEDDLCPTGGAVDIPRVWSGMFEPEPANNSIGQLRGKWPAGDAFNNRREKAEGSCVVTISGSRSFRGCM